MKLSLARGELQTYCQAENTLDSHCVDFRAANLLLFRLLQARTEKRYRLSGLLKYLNEDCH
jgi:hypothetical protein